MRRLLFGAVVLGMWFAGASAAQAATIPVNTNADTPLSETGTCSLRQAVISANFDLPGSGACVAGAGDDVIQLPGGRYELSLLGAGEGSSTTGSLDISSFDDLTIEPTGINQTVTIDGLYADRIFNHIGTGNGDLVLRNLALVKGQTTGVEASSSGLQGGAIRNVHGRLILQGVLLFDNRSGFDGGAIWNNAELNMVNTTLSTNQASRSGGGIFNDVDGTASIRSSTITLNRADSNANGTGGGGGFRSEAALPFNMTNSILAGNFDDSPADPDSTPDCASGPFFFPRYVISTQALGAGDCLIGNDPGTNRSPRDPRLEGLADNVGQTFTHAIGPGSIAIDSAGSGAPDLCPTVDQRGAIRPLEACDIGAYEYDQTVLPPEPLPGLAAPSNTIATFDGVNLHVRLKCPGRFKPRCFSSAVPVTARGNGEQMAAPKRVRTLSNRWKRVSFAIKPAYRARVEAMTFFDAKRLIVKQKIKSKRVRRKISKRPSRLFHSYKVRVAL